MSFLHQILSINKESMTGIALMRFYDYFKFDTFFYPHLRLVFMTSVLKGIYNKKSYNKIYTNIYYIVLKFKRVLL